MTFNERLKDLMTEENISNEQLGKIIGIDASSVSRLKDGIHSIKLSKAIAIANHYICSLDYLFVRTEKYLDFTICEPLNFYENLRKIMKDHKITRYRIIKDLKKSNGHFDYWKKGGDPFMQTIIELADYLKITIDYLIGRDQSI